MTQAAGRAAYGHQAMTATLRDRIRKTLTDWGLDALTADPPHDWRCQYTDRFPEPCTCVDDLVEDIVEAVYGPQEAKP